jgi:hypothetical protein
VGTRGGGREISTRLSAVPRRRSAYHTTRRDHAHDTLHSARRDVALLWLLFNDAELGVIVHHPAVVLLHPLHIHNHRHSNSSSVIRTPAQGLRQRSQRDRSECACSIWTVALQFCAYIKIHSSPPVTETPHVSTHLAAIFREKLLPPCHFQTICLLKVSHAYRIFFEMRVIKLSPSQAMEACGFVRC